MKNLDKTLALAFATMMTPVQANIDSITHQSNENAITVLSQTSTDGQWEFITFEDAKNMQEFQWLFEEMMNDEKIKVLIDKYWYEEVQKVLKKIIFDPNTTRHLKKLLEDEEIQQALKEWNEELVKQKVSDECKTHVWRIVFCTIMVEALSAFLFWVGLAIKDNKKNPPRVPGYNP